MIRWHVLNSDLLVLITLELLKLHQKLGVLKYFSRIFIKLVNFVQIKFSKHLQTFLALVDLDLANAQFQPFYRLQSLLPIVSICHQVQELVWQHHVIKHSVVYRIPRLNCLWSLVCTH